MSAFHFVVTSVTHNIPSILRDPAVALIGQECYTVLVYDFDITHTPCLKYALSKGLGLGIVLGGGIVKIPQIMKIVSSRSARGLSLPAYILETAACAVSLAYASRNRFPFSTYGENFFLTFQNVIITLLITYCSGAGGAVGDNRGKVLTSPGNNNLVKVLTGAGLAVASGFVLWSKQLCPPPMLSILQAANLPISLASKAPQILSNYRNRSTGNVSAFAVFNTLLGCLARVFTTKQEVNDPLVFWGYVAATLLNGILATQMILYWHTGAQSNAKFDARRRGATEDGMSQSIPLRTESEESGVPGRKWSRKLD